MSDEEPNRQRVGAFDDGKEVSSLGPPAPSDEQRAIGGDAIERAGGVPNETPDLRPRVVISEEAVEAFRKAIEFAPLKHDAGEPIRVVDGDGKLLFMVDYPELVKPDMVTLLETILESRWIVQSGQCATCGVGLVDTFDALDMDDEERLICIRCSQSDYEDWCRDHDDDGQRMS